MDTSDHSDISSSGPQRILIARDEAKLRGLKRYFTGTPCRNGHTAERKVDSWSCVDCVNQNRNRNRANNREQVRADNNAYLAKNRHRQRAWWAKYYENNRQKMIDRSAQYYVGNKEKIVSKKMARLAVDIQFRIATRLRIRLYHALRNRYKAGSAVTDLDCSIDFLIQHLQSQFTDGMSWDNYGNKKGQWNIDHRRPLTAFNLEDRDQLLLACHYSNLQPMWALDNIRKGGTKRTAQASGGRATPSV